VAGLVSVWLDPDFDADQRVFYYARVLEIPTPPWYLYDMVDMASMCLKARRWSIRNAPTRRPSGTRQRTQDERGTAAILPLPGTFVIRLWFRRTVYAPVAQTRIPARPSGTDARAATQSF
jgi:hypothetical protein